jgi:hypothetical protein
LDFSQALRLRQSRLRGGIVSVGAARRSGEAYETVVFTAKEAERLPTARYLTLEDQKVRDPAMRMPRFAPGQPIPVVSIPNLSADVFGIWSLWRIAIATMDWNRQRIMPLFLADNDMVYMPTAMGQVYRARDTKLNRDVPLQILPDAFAGDPDPLARFTCEEQTPR